MKKRYVSLMLAGLMILAAFISGCSGKNDESSKSSEKEKSKESVSQTSEVSEKSRKSVDTAISSVSSPLGLNEWGKAAKFCTADGTYKDVPIRITSVRRGEKVTNEVRQAANSSALLTFYEPDEKEEYAIAEYEMSLDGFPVKEGGTQADIFASVSGPDGEMIKLENGSYWGTTALSLVGDDEYYYEDIVKGKLAYKIIQGYNDYLLIVGEIGETQAYFKPER